MPRSLRVVAQMLVVVLVAAATAGCELVGDIFQAGFWVGVIGVIVVLALVGWLVAKMR